MATPALVVAPMWMDMALSFAMLVGHSRTCDVSALRLCLFPLELMNGRQIATAGLRTHLTCDWWTVRHCNTQRQLTFYAMARCRFASAFNHWDSARCGADWRVGLMGTTCVASQMEYLQFATDHHCTLSDCRFQALEIKFHNKCFASDSAIARSRSTMTGTKASASSADE
jgi:hypothetical protein